MITVWHLFGGRLLNQAMYKHMYTLIRLFIHLVFPLSLIIIKNVNVFISQDVIRILQLDSQNNEIKTIKFSGFVK